MDIKYDQNGLVPAIAQDVTGEVLMLAWMNEEAVKLTLTTNIVHYFSRSRQKIWKKGETSGNLQHLKGFAYDCDGDAILVTVDQIGVACHTGAYSCFFHEVTEAERRRDTMQTLYQTILERRVNPKEGSYTNYLFDKGIDKILKKVGEEAAEVIIGAKNTREELIYETGDLLYHLLVLLADQNVTLGEIYKELEGRMK